MASLDGCTKTCIACEISSLLFYKTKYKKLLELNFYRRNSKNNLHNKYNMSLGVALSRGDSRLAKADT